MMVQEGLEGEEEWEGEEGRGEVRRDEGGRGA